MKMKIKYDISRFSHLSHYSSSRLCLLFMYAMFSPFFWGAVC